MKSRKTWRKVLSVSLAAAMLVGTSFSASEPLLGTGISVRAENTEQNAPVFSWDNATVYFLMTDRFNNGNEENDNAYGRQEIDVGDQRATFHGGDFAGITDKINEGYFNDLGVNAIWLTAPYEQIHGYVLGDNFAHYSYHGYYVLDYTEPDAAFGTKQEFQTLVDTAHEHGIRIVIDVVMNHAGYNDIIDMNEYNFGTLLDGWKKVYDDADFSQYHSKIDYSSSSSDWRRWWGSNWVRSGLPGYTENSGSELTACLTGLPDFKTEQTTKVGIPQFLQTKWTKEGTLEEKIEKYGSSNTVTGYISDWLAEWVRAYGIDGFRCDTAKHVDKASWKKLKDKCVAALKEWKQANPTKKMDDLDFWMTGEHWDHGCYKDAYYTEGGFDSMINFETTGGGLLAAGRIADVYQGYADKINSDPEFNVLSYISSHDSTLARPSDMYYMGSAFLLMPGAVQIYYGDESARPFVSGIPNDGNGGAGHSLRSDMNWGENADLTAHWGIVGRFRNNHLAVGAGANTALNTSSGIAFARTYNDDKIAAVINASGSVSVNVSSLWDNGTELENFYDGSKAVVTDGAVTFDAGEHGTILIQEPAEQAEGRGTVTVEHIDTENGSVLKTQTLSGVAGSSYSVSADTQLLKNYELVQTEGNATGTYSSEGAVVKFYYRALPVTALTIHYYNANWNNVNIYSYDQTETKQYTGKWPGTAMNSDGDGWWSYSIEDAENAFVVFNDGTNQDPGYMQPGYNVSDESWIKDGQILTESPEEPLPAGNISASPENGEFTDTVSVTLSASNATDTAYTTSEGVTGSFADGQTITIGQNTAPGDTVTLTLTGKGADGKALLQTYTYSKKTQTTENVLLYFDNSSYNWSNVYAYVYIGDGANSQSMAAWPGVKMTEKNSQGYFMLNVAEGFENGRVIFNDGTGSSVNRYPGDQQPGLSIGGFSKLFNAGNKWDDYSEEEVPPPSPEPTVTVDKENGTSFTTETFDITLSLLNATSATYSVDDGSEKTITKTTKITIGEGKIADTDVIVKGTVTNGRKTNSFSFSYNKKYVKKTTSTSASLASVYQTNGIGKGKEAVITIDGDAGDWSEDMMVAQGAAWDVANHWKGSYENCLLDTYALFAAWDNDNLYIGCQMVNTTDTWANSGEGPLMDGAGIGNVPQILALSIDSSSPTMTNMENSTGKPIWNMGGVSFETHVDRLLYMSGVPGRGSMYAPADAEGNTDYDSACISFQNGGIEYKAARTNICSKIMGLNSSQSPEDVFDDNADWVDYKTYQGSQGVHSTSLDTFYEVKIPLATLGITKEYLTNNGIGAMWLATRGESPLDCIPFDSSMVDHAKDSYTDDPSTSAEKNDVDNITVPLARIGANGDTPVPADIPLQVNFGTDRSAPQLSETALTIKGIGYGGTPPYKYEFSVDGKVIQASGTKDSVSWTPTTEGQHTLKCVITDAKGVTATNEKTFTSEGGEIIVIDNLSNKSTVSASTVTLGQTVAVNAKAQGGNAPYRYEVIYKLSTASNWKTLQDYNSNASVSFTPDKAGTYNIRVTAKDAEGTTAEKNLSVTVQAPALENTSSLSATEIELGETVDITASATGGSGEYKYQIVYKQKAATSWSTLQPYSTNASASFNPSKAGDYDVCVKVKDSYNKEVKKFFEVSVKQPVPLENTSALSALNINLGDSIQVNCSATGGTGEYRYQVVYKQETQEKWSTAQPYSTTDSVSIKPAKAVVYDVCVKVKDSINTEVKKFYKVTVTDNRPKNISSISATSVELGETIVVKAKASGSTGFFQYAVYYKKSADTKWTTKQGFKANSTVVIQPAKATTYEICVKIQDDQGTVVKKYFTVEVTEHKDALSNTSTVSETNLVLGETAVVSASASGSTGFYQYAVSYRGENDTKWTVMQDYSSDDTVKVKPAAVGAYEICVSVRDNKKNEAKKYFTLNVSESSDD